MNSTAAPNSSRTANHNHHLSRRVLPRPLLRKLIIPGAVILVLLSDAALNRIIRHGLHEQLSRKLQHGSDLRTRLPLVGPQHPQTHAPLVIVRHVGVVDLGSERHGRRLERVLGGELQLDEEFSILYWAESRLRLAFAWTFLLLFRSVRLNGAQRGGGGAFLKETRESTWNGDPSGPSM